LLTIIGSGSVSLVALVALRPVAFDLAFGAGILVSTALSLLTRGFRWLSFFSTVGSGSTVVAAAFARALVVLVVVGAGVTSPALVLVEALVAAVDLLAMAYE
jgi:hypothetical protein